MTTPSSFLSTVSIHCSWCIIKDPGHEEVHGRIWPPKCSAWHGEIASLGVPHVFESALAVPWAVLTHSSWAKLMLAETLLLNCTWMSFLDGLLQRSGCVQVNSNFSQTKWQPHEGREAFRIMKAKINLYTQPAGCLSGSPAEQEYHLFSYWLEDMNTI